MMVFDRLKEGQLSLGAVAGQLQISYRQCTRSYKRYRAEGSKGLVHRNRGHPSNRAKPKEFRCEALRLYEQQLLGIEPMTAFGKACNKLGTEIITANSPQAKGRVERNHAVYQDRFVKELALRGITTIDGANQLLTGGFVDELNTKFAKKAKEEQDYHRRVPEDLRLHEVFSFEETRVVMNDWTIRYNNRMLQILKENRPIPRPTERVIVRTHLDGQIELLYRDKKLKFRPITSSEMPVVGVTKHKSAKSVTSSSRSSADGGKNKVSSKTHPWRLNYKLMRGSAKR